MTVCFDRGGWSPALFADITAAGFDLLTYRKGAAPDLLGSAFTTLACTGHRGRQHEYELADTTMTLEITEGPRTGEQVTLRQVSRREPASGGADRLLTMQADTVWRRRIQSDYCSSEESRCLRKSDCVCGYPGSLSLG